MLLIAGTAGALFARGAEFYLLNRHARIDHPDYNLLSPGRFVGHGYGIAGTALMLTNLLYLARRRLAKWHLGSMSAWLNMHVATGLLGGVLVLFHSAFQLRNPLATATMWALGIVLVTGLIGRFIFALVPSPDTKRLDELCRTFETIVPGLGQTLALRLQNAPITKLSGRVTFFKVLRTLRRWRGDSVRRREIVLSTAAEHGHTHRDELELIRGRIEEAADIASGMPRAIALDSVMRSWRGLHRFFALLMIALVAVHIAVAWYYGYRWIFSDGRAG